MPDWKSLTRNLLLIVCALAAAGAQAAAGGVTVFAAASLADALDAAARSYGAKVTVSYGASSTLARQIENGAPADVFISADLDWMDFLGERKLVVPGSRVNLLRNRLVLIAPADSRASLEIKPGFSLAAALGGGRLAMANPQGVPAGKYGKAALESLGVWRSVADRIAPAENVRAALALVARGEAPFGIVYRTDALAEKKVKIVGEFPAGSHPPIVYPAAAVATGRRDAAQAFLDYLGSARARAVFAAHGF